MILEQRWTVICNVNGYNQRKEKELLLGSQVDSSLNNTLKSYAKCKIKSKNNCFTGPKSPLEAFENVLAVVCVLPEAAKVEALKGQTDFLFLFCSLFLVYISGIQSYLRKCDCEYLKVQNAEQQEVCGMNHRWIK